MDLELSGERVMVYVHETIEQNIGRYYDQIKKFKKKKAGALAAMERTVPEKPRRKQSLASRRSGGTTGSAGSPRATESLS